MGYSLYTIASENNFLKVLAQWLLSGAGQEKTLSRVTILVPNRRSARALEAILLKESGANAMLLPNIKPIGDIDEDLNADSLPEEGVADAISKSAHLHAILNLLLQWANANSDSELAQDVLASGTQAFTLAQSLQQLINQFETEDVEIDKLQGVYDLDLAGHRQNILDLLQVITTQLPELLTKHNLIGPSARRNLLIRLEAERIAGKKHKGPIIAVGSTGTNPATRDLLQAIALDPMGAVVFPGLDQELDERGWNAITSEHPQYSLKSMLDQWGVKRSDIKVMGASQSKRMWLMGEVLRPADVADQWQETLPGQLTGLKSGLRGVELIETSDRQQEAEVIAFALRQHVENSGRKAALMTPDRDLATRVKAALQRWNLPIDDSAGVPLLHVGRAALLLLLLKAVEERFSASSLFALLNHVDCTFGLEKENQNRRVNILELVAFRGLPEPNSIKYLVERVKLQQQETAQNPHTPLVIKNLTVEQWAEAVQLAAQIVTSLLPLADGLERSLHDHIVVLLAALESIAPLVDDISPVDQLFLDVMTSLQEESTWHPLLPLSKTQHSICHALSMETLRPPFNPDAQLSIYGLAEARLNDAELLIMGGLTEGAWPARPESGPWLNRPMREVLKLQQPERNIGVTAHDFAQGFGHENVILSWPRRLNGAPVIPSRWVLRLLAVAKATGYEVDQRSANYFIEITKKIDEPETFAPIQRPRPSPPLHARPTTFSVSRIEKLIRDSYHVYANQILKLQPLEPIGQDVEASLRGSLIHAALHAWNVATVHVPESEYLHLLLQKGREAFAPYFETPEVRRFWWPRFEGMAKSFIEVDRGLRANLVSSLTEISGKYECNIGGVIHTITARADRIDVLKTGELRIIDYKSGSVPTSKQVKSGMSPQLTLEGLIATKGKFKAIESKTLDDVMFLTVGGKDEGVKSISLSKSGEIIEEIGLAEQGLLKLLADYQDPSKHYMPRHNLQTTNDVSDYDHLSRRLEWELEGVSK